MADFPGFPCNDFDFHFEEVGPALAGLIVRDVDGNPRPGLLPSRPEIILKRADWFLDTLPFVAVRAKGRAVLIGGTTEAGQLEIAPAPAANARLDVIWTRPADMDAGEENVPLSVTTGVPAAVPSKPGIPEGAIEVGTFRLPAGSTGTGGGVFTPTFPTTVTAGGVIPFRSTAERNAFAAVPGQLAVVGSVLWQRSGNAWVRAIPDETLEIYSTTVSTRPIPGNGSAEVNLGFPSGKFSSTPVVTATPWGGTGKFTAQVAAISSTGCRVVLRNLDSVERTFGAQVIAVKE